MQSNIVVVVLDDTPMDVLVGMPFLDSEPEGHWVRFAQSFVNRPICSTSRASLFTGMTMRRHGVFRNTDADNNNHAGLIERNLFPVALQRAGYKTGHYGKYQNGYAGWGGNAGLVASGWNDWWALCEERYVDFDVCENGTVVNYNDGEISTDLMFDRAETFVSTAQEPFCAYIAPFAPHATAVSASRHDELYSTDDLVSRANRNEADISDKPAFLSQSYPTQRTSEELADFDDEHVRSFRAARAVDEGIEALMDALDARGSLDHTVIIIIADNSNHFGEHRISNIKGFLYEECITAHMMIRDPRASARTSQAIVSNVDIAPTLCELAGTRLPVAPDGMSLVPVLRGQIADADFREAVLIERPGQSDRQCRGLRTTDWKYVLYDTGEEELYDLVEDPFEMDNAASTNTTKAAQMRRHLQNLEAKSGLPDWSIV